MPASATWSGNDMTLEELGTSIREKREAAGMSIDDVVSRIKISARILRTIEEGSLVGLPHAVYTKSFIRAFGQLVGYDLQELNAVLEELFPSDAFDESKAESILLSNPALAYPDAGKRFAVIIFLLVFLVSLIGGGWYVAMHYGEQIIEAVKVPFSAITSPAEESQEQRPAKPAETPGANSGLSNTLPASAGRLPATQTGVPAARISSSPGAVSASPASNAANDSPASAGVGASGPENSVNLAPSMNSTIPSAAEAVPARPTPVPAPVNAEASTPGGKNTFVVRTSEECWIRSRADSGRMREFMAQAGTNFTITYDQRLEITFGNAGGVNLAHNDKNLGTPGSRGQIVTLRFPGQQ